MEKIYIKLLDEGTVVYRPVQAEIIGNGVYRITDQELYKPEIETWEFIPGQVVEVEERELNAGDKRKSVCRVAVRESGLDFSEQA